MKTALVTGGAGFIGSHMCEMLVGRGYQVTCLDDFSTGSRENVSKLKKLEVIEGDVNDWDCVAQLASRKFDVVFHYAARVGVQRTEEQPLKVLDDIQGMRNLAQLAQEGVVGKIVFASSSEVYGNPIRIPEDEQGGIVGWTPYTAVKLYGEHLFSSLWQEHRIPTVSLRFFNVYGPRQIGTAYGFVVSIFINQALEGKPITVFGDGNQTRDFVHVSDNVNMTLAAADSKASWGEVMNVGAGREKSIIDLALLVNKIAGRGELSVQYLPAREREVDRRLAATEKFNKLVGVKCQVSLEEGIEITIKQRQADECWRKERLQMAAVEA